MVLVREAAIFFSVPATKKKDLFWISKKSSPKNVSTKLEEGGGEGKALAASLTPWNKTTLTWAITSQKYRRHHDETFWETQCRRNAFKTKGTKIANFLPNFGRFSVEFIWLQPYSYDVVCGKPISRLHHRNNSDKISPELIQKT